MFVIHSMLIMCAVCCQILLVIGTVRYVSCVCYLIYMSYAFVHVGISVMLVCCDI